MKIGKLILKYEKKIGEQKKLIAEQVKLLNKITSDNQYSRGLLENRLSELQKEYALFVQNSGDKIQELKKVKSDLNQLETMLMYFAESKYFSIDEIEYQKPIPGNQKVTVKITNHGEPILP